MTGFQYVFDTHVNVVGKHVLVIGSERPWIEAMLLLSGAEHVTSLDYIPDLQSSHPQVGFLLYGKILSYKITEV